MSCTFLRICISLRTVLRLFVVANFLLFSIATSASAQKFDDGDRARGRRILKRIKSEIKDKYYDPKFHGVDIETVFEKADGLLAQANSNNDMWGVIAQCLMLLNDSHTTFYPLDFTLQLNYGWNMQMIGDKCYVTSVEPDSDAKRKQLSIGEQVLTIEGIVPTRNNFWVLNYLNYNLRPLKNLRVTVQTQGGVRRELTLEADVKRWRDDLPGTSFQWDKQGAEIRDYMRLNRDRFYEISSDLLVWKMRGFNQTDDEIDKQMNRAKRFNSLVLDLRGNAGGYESTLLRLLGHFAPSDLKVGNMKLRKEFKSMIAKSRGSNFFKGKLMVLVDSNSASASELFARVMQLEKRGTVIGDVTAGEVMRARYRDYEDGFGLSITESDIMMEDGKSLEHTGVTPDVPMLPSATDLAMQRDPVLAHAASLAGITLTPEQAGAAFPLEWRKGR